MGRATPIVMIAVLAGLLGVVFTGCKKPQAGPPRPPVTAEPSGPESPAFVEQETPTAVEEPSLESPASVEQETPTAAEEPSLESPASVEQETPTAAEEPSEAEAVGEEEGGEINWVTSYEDGMETAQKEHKPVIMDLGADWCGACQILDTDTWSDARVQELATSFVCMKIDVDKDNATANKYQARFIPLVVFLNPEGSEIDRQVGFIDASKMAEKMQKALNQ